MIVTKIFRVLLLLGSGVIAGVLFMAVESQVLCSTAELHADTSPEVPARYSDIDTTGWAVFEDRHIGIAFRYPEGMKVSTEWHEKGSPPQVPGLEVTEGSMAPYDYLRIVLTDSSSHEPSRYVSFHLAPLNEPSVKHGTGTTTLVEAFTGDPVDPDASLEQITAQLNAVYLDTAFPLVIDLGPNKAIRFFALSNYYGLSAREQLVMPLSNRKYSNLLFTDIGGWRDVHHSASDQHRVLEQAIGGARIARPPLSEEVIGILTSFHEIGS